MDYSNLILSFFKEINSTPLPTKELNEDFKKYPTKCFLETFVRSFPLLKEDYTCTVHHVLTQIVSAEDRTYAFLDLVKQESQETKEMIRNSVEESSRYFKSKSIVKNPSFRLQQLSYMF